MHYRLTIPTRINIQGNPSDENEGDFATISATANLYADATIDDLEGSQISRPHISKQGLAIEKYYSDSDIQDFRKSQKNPNRINPKIKLRLNFKCKPSS
jgi:hypothetical protein